VAAIEPAGDDGGDEELAAIGILSAVGHAEETLAGVLELEVLIRELGSIDGFTWCTKSAYVSNAIRPGTLRTAGSIALGKIWGLVSTANPIRGYYKLHLPPPWIMKLLITRWKVDPSYPKPFSPVARALWSVSDLEAIRRVVDGRTGSSRRSWEQSCRKGR
jgi:hypothetical protein